MFWAHLMVVDSALPPASESQGLACGPHRHCSRLLYILARPSSHSLPAAYSAGTMINFLSLYRPKASEV
jgi:hypothetical protein